MQSFNDERESAGPGEAEGEADGVAEGGLGAVGHAEGVGSQHGGDGAAVGAGRLGGDAGLVVLEAHAEEGLAVALLQPGAAAPPAAAVAVPQQPLLIDKLLQLQLEHPGAPHLAMAKQYREDGKSQHGLTSHFGGEGFSFLLFPFLSRAKKSSVSQEAWAGEASCASRVSVKVCLSQESLFLFFFLVMLLGRLTALLGGKKR